MAVQSAARARSDRALRCGRIEQREGQQRHPERQIEVEEAPEEGPVVHQGQGQQRQDSGLARGAQDGEDAERVGDGGEEDDDAHGERQGHDLRQTDRQEAGQEVQGPPDRRLVESIEAETGLADVEENRCDRDVLRQVRHREIGEEQRGGGKDRDRGGRQPARDSGRGGRRSVLHQPRGVAHAIAPGQARLRRGDLVRYAGYGEAFAARRSRSATGVRPTWYSRAARWSRGSGSPGLAAIRRVASSKASYHRPRLA